MTDETFRWLELAAEDAAGAGGFVDDDLDETGELGGEFLPEPTGHDLDGGVLEAFDLVEVTVIEAVHEGLHGTGDLGVVINPADSGVHLSLNDDLDLEAVPMHLGALMSVGEIGQRLGGLEAEVFDDSCAHGFYLRVGAGASSSTGWAAGMTEGDSSSLGKRVKRSR